MASALSQVETDKEVKDRLESMDSTLKSMYSAQLKFYKDEDKYRRRREQAEKRRRGDKRHLWVPLRKIKMAKRKRSY